MAPYDWKVTVKSGAKVAIYAAVGYLLLDVPFIQWSISGLPPLVQASVVASLLPMARSFIVAKLRINLGGILGVAR